MYTLQFSDGARAAFDAGTKVIVLSAAERANLDADYPGWTGLFDVPGQELSALHAECRGRHDNPLFAAYPYAHSRHPGHRPTLGSYVGAIESLASTVIGSTVLILMNLPKFGECWMPAKVTATSDRVLLADGRVAPASTPAARLIDREALGDGRVEMAADGSPWRRKGREVTRIAKFCGDVATLGQLAAAGLTDVVILDGERWTAVEVA